MYYNSSFMKVVDSGTLCGLCWRTLHFLIAEENTRIDIKSSGT